MRFAKYVIKKIRDLKEVVGICALPIIVAYIVWRMIDPFTEVFIFLALCEFFILSFFVGFFILSEIYEDYKKWKNEEVQD